MAPFNLQASGLGPSNLLLRVGLASHKRRRYGIRHAKPLCRLNRRSPSSLPLRRFESSQQVPREVSAISQEKKSSSLDTVSTALHNADPSNNNLLSPVHIPEDPSGVLNEKHPAAGLLANSSIVVTRQMELMNIMVGFEQANKYVIMDPLGQHIGYMAETDLGMGSMLKRQMFNTHRSFTTHVFDRYGKEVLRFHRPFSWISSRIGIHDPLLPGDYAPSLSTAVSPISSGGLTTDINQDAARVSPLPLAEMRIIGEAQQQWAPLRRKYNLFVHRDDHDPSAPQLTSGDLPLSNSTGLQPSTAEAPNSGGEFGQFAYVDEPFLSWDFSLLTSDSKLLGSVNRNFAGFGREIFTDTGVYALRMDAASLAQEPGHMISNTGQKAQPAGGPGMTLDQRAVMLATAVSVDFDYFSRKSGGSGMMGGMWPVWLPGGGGGAAGAEAGAEDGALEGAGQGAAGGNLERTAEGAGGAAAGAGTMAGYEAMQRGLEEDGSRGNDPTPTIDPGVGPHTPNTPNQQPSQVNEGEDVWGFDEDPYSQDNSGDTNGGNSGGDAGDGGDGGWFDGLSDFFDS